MAHGGRRNVRLSDDETTTYTVRGVRTLLPEAGIPTIALKVPEMKNETSHWQIGTASVTRVKISALNPEVKINTAEAGTISGMFSELYGPVATLGIAVVHILDIPIKVHVTRSTKVAPIVSDGVLGHDFFDAAGVLLRLGRDEGTMTLAGRRTPVPISDPKDLIPNYLNLLRRRMIQSSIEHEKGAWSVSKSLKKLRDFLPRKIASETEGPVLEILEEYFDCFHLPGDKLGFTELLTYSIRSKDDATVNVPQYDLPERDQDEIERQVKDLLDQGIIKVSESPFNSPMRLIERKPDVKGNLKYRMAADFHELNNRSTGDAFPIPDIIDLVDQLHGSKYFSVIDLASAAYQIALDPKDRRKTAFTTRSGHYEFQRMPIGIKNASQNVQRLMCDVLNDMLAANMVFVCHDDILIHASSLEEHEVRTRRVLARIRNAGLKLQPGKCQLFQTNVLYLGYLVTSEGLRPDPVKINKLLCDELPKTAQCLSRYLGLLSSFKRFIPNFTSRCHPIYNLLKNKTTVEWTREAIVCFDDLRQELSKDLLLQYPDWSRNFVLEASASKYGIQAALMQRKSTSGKLLPIAYASRSYSATEAKYDKYEKEIVAATYGMESWYWYFSELEDKEFVLRTREPKAFDWFIKRRWHRSEVRSLFELRFSSDHRFKIEPLSKS